MQRPQDETYLQPDEFLLQSPQFRFTERVLELKEKLSPQERNALDEHILDLNDGDFQSVERDPLFDSISDEKRNITHTSDMTGAIQRLYLGDSILLLEHRERLRRERRKIARQQRKSKSGKKERSKTRSSRGGKRIKMRKSRVRGKTRRHAKTKKN